MSLVGTLGEVAIVPDSMEGWNIARAIARIPPIPVVNPKWIALALQSPNTQELIRSWATTTVQATLNLKEVAKLPIPFPPRTEREAIAHILVQNDAFYMWRRTEPEVQLPSQSTVDQQQPGGPKYYLSFVRANAGTDIDKYRL